MIRRSSLLIPAVLFLSLAPRAHANTLNVPGSDYPTIQAAINAATAGDTILVAAGTYRESLVWEYKELTLQGAGPGACIIDPSTVNGGPGGRCLVTGGLSSTSRIDGFTLQNGVGDQPNDGGGMYNYYSTLLISNCTFGGNGALNGGGMANAESNPVITSCTFISNLAASGGAMLNTASSPVVTSCAFVNNDAFYNGGGIENSANSSPIVSGCTFRGNKAESGGGMANFTASPVIADCAFIGNSADGGGGMANAEDSHSLVSRCVFYGNSAEFGGGVGNYGSSTTIQGCVFSGNRSQGGGAVFNRLSNPTVADCTFSANAPDAIYDNNSSFPVIMNCVLWGDGDGGFPAEIDSDPYAPTLAVVSYSDVQGGYAGAGNLDADPLFVRNPDPYSGDYGDLRLRKGSPCIDTGSNAAVPSGLTTDLAGNPRTIDGDLDGTSTVDMGAYEYLPAPKDVAVHDMHDLMNSVKQLVSLGAALPADGQSLYAKLSAAITALQAGDIATAISDLQAFINQVRSFIKTGRLSASDGQALIDQAQAIITLLGG